MVFFSIMIHIFRVKNKAYINQLNQALCVRLSRELCCFYCEFRNNKKNNLLYVPSNSCTAGEEESENKMKIRWKCDFDLFLHHISFDLARKALSVVIKHEE